MNKRLKRILMILAVFSVILCSFNPAIKTYAAGATASGTASMKNATLFKDGTATVNLSITGTQATVSQTIPNDVVIIADNSGSMGWDGKIDSLKKAVKQFTSTVRLDKHRIGVVAFADYTKILDFSTDKSLINAFTDSMYANGGTYVGPAIDAAVNMLKNNKRDGAKPTIILLTDGEAGDRAAMLAAADRAKAEGFVFYTIALLDDLSDPDNNSYNNDMKLLATTEAHHHFVGVDNLEELYNALADYVGVENPYNVVVKQKIADEFEYVPGSADKNIPVPTIEGNTLTWNMLEIKNTTIKLSYKIRPKNSDMANGSYKVCSSSYLTYEDYAGNQFKKSIAIPTVNVMPYTDPTVTGMSPSCSDEGVETGVKINYGYISYDEDFEVRMNGKPVQTTYTGSGYSKFKVTSSMAPGIYKVTILNHGRTVDVGNYEIKKVVPPDILVGKINVLSGNEGVETIEKVTVSNLSKYADDFRVLVDGNEATVSYKGSSYFKFAIPKTLKPGNYKCEAVNNGIKYDLGTYTVKEVPIPDVTFGSLSVPNGKQGETPTEKVTVSTKPEYSKLNILVNEELCQLSYTSSSYFKFAIPKGLLPGEYEVKAIYGGKEIIIGTYTVKEDVKPGPTFSKISVTSGNEGESISEKITFTNMSSYPSDFKVTVNGIECGLTYSGSSYFKFNTPKKLTVGDYEVKVICDGKEYSLGFYNVKEVTVPDVTFGKLSVVSGEKGETPKEKITVSKKPDYSRLNVYVGGVECSLTYSSSSYFKFDIPSGLESGVYEVNIVHGKNTIVLGNYTVKDSTKPAPKLGQLSVTSGMLGDTPSEKITISSTSGYPSDFAVVVDDIGCKVTYTSSSYFKFNIPQGLTAGEHVVKVIFDGNEYVLGNYTVQTETIEKFVVRNVEKYDSVIKVYVNNMDPSGLTSVYVGGVKVPLTYKSSSYFKFNLNGQAGDVSVDYFNYSNMDLGLTY